MVASSEDEPAAVQRIAASASAG